LRGLKKLGVNAIIEVDFETREVLEYVSCPSTGPRPR